MIKGLSNFCIDLDFKISPDGCLADFAVKPKECAEDKWLPVQMKTTLSCSHGKYSFRLKEEYKDMCVICFAIQDQRVWIVTYNAIQIKRINIGKHSSIYDQYEIGTSELSHKLVDIFYKSRTYHIKDIINLLPDQMKQERDFREFRENTFPDLILEYPEVDARVYDVIINKRYKVQDKVITCYLHPNNKKMNYMVHLSKNQSKYCYGDNDYYWLFLPDKKGAYILPETCLMDTNILTLTNVHMEGTFTVILHPYKVDVSGLKYGWMNNHLYFFDKPNDVNRIYSLFGNDKPELNITVECFEITGKNRFNNLDKTYVHDLVVSIFKNVTKKLQEESPKQIKANIRLCKMCNDQIGEKNKTGYCDTCYPKMVVQTGKARKVARPPYEELLAQLKTSNYMQVSKKYGVSDNSIRKWIKIYEKYHDCRKQGDIIATFGVVPTKA